MSNFVEEEQQRYVTISWKQAFGVESLTEIKDPRHRQLASQENEWNIRFLTPLPLRVFVQENEPEYHCEIIPLEQAVWEPDRGLRVLEGEDNE